MNENAKAGLVGVGIIGTSLMVSHVLGETSELRAWDPKNSLTSNRGFAAVVGSLGLGAGVAAERLLGRRGEIGMSILSALLVGASLLPPGEDPEGLVHEAQKTVGPAGLGLGAGLVAGRLWSMAKKP